MDKKHPRMGCDRYTHSEQVHSGLPILSSQRPTHNKRKSTYILIFFDSCLTSICNPVGYDRHGHLYLYRKSSPAFRPSLVHLHAILLCLIDDFWKSCPPDSAASLTLQAVPRLPDHSFAAILVLVPSPLFFPLLQLISKIPKRTHRLFICE